LVGWAHLAQESPLVAANGDKGMVKPDPGGTNRRGRKGQIDKQMYFISR
jgi:hypothetical protein